MAKGKGLRTVEQTMDWMGVGAKHVTIDCGVCPTCGKAFSEGLFCSNAFHAPPCVPVYWPKDVSDGV